MQFVMPEPPREKVRTWPSGLIRKAGDDRQDTGQLPAEHPLGFSASVALRVKKINVAASKKVNPK